MLGKRGTGKPDEIGPWSKDKLNLLQKYLDAYAHIMGSQEWCCGYHYIDAFAGSVYPKLKSNVPAAQGRFTIIESEQEQYIEGSPKRALRTTPPFTVCWFIELAPKRLDTLRALQSEFPDRDIRIRDTDCNQVLRTEIVPQITKKSAQRAIVFLDPYSLQVEWATVQALATAGTFDIFVNFSLMGITRLLKRDEPPDAHTTDLLSRVMGNTSWVAKLYERSPERSVLPMFPDEPLVGSANREVLRAEWLARLYIEQVQELFTYASKPVIMKNSRQSPLYALFLASHNATGVSIGNSIFSRYERLREIGK